MARKLFIAGNWKMNTSRQTATALAADLAKAIGGIDAVDVAVAPPLVYLADVAEALSGSNIDVAAQNMFFEDPGAFTGEIAAEMLKDVGCRFAILGHSERRHVLGESDEWVNRKVHKALSVGLDVILCVGELKEQREANQTMDVVGRQLRVGLEGVGAGEIERVTVAYEPVWAIGTGLTASPEQAQEVHAEIRAILGDVYGSGVAEALRIQYGGSVKASNAAELLALPDVDGVLVGGASLKADEFAAIARAGV